MAVGKPVIGSINGACANFIVNNEIGYVCASGDYEKLANTISNLDEKELVNIGKKSKQVYITKYNKNLFINALINNLKKL